MRRTASFVEHAFLRDPTQWSTQNACVEVTKQTIGRLIAAQPVRRVDVGTAARLLCGTTVNAVFWVAASEELRFVQPNHRNKRHRQHHHQKTSAMQTARTTMHRLPLLWSICGQWIVASRLLWRANSIKTKRLPVSIALNDIYL
ncbi:hypothetical protein ACI50E_21500 [Brucella sp. ZJ1_1]